MEILIFVFIGLIATGLMDLWGLFLLKAFSIKGLDYRFVGRWLFHMREGTFFHENIIKARPIPYERSLGWGCHYLIGITFSILLYFVYGDVWLNEPSIFPALLIGILTLVAPYFIMQPAFGFGIAGSKTPSPNLVRFKSFVAHCSYGVGLYLGGLVWKYASSIFQ